MIITKIGTQHTKQPTRKGKLEPIMFFIIQSNILFTIQYTYIIQACQDSSTNTLRLDSTHPDTYNLVGFSGCLHLWWIPLLIPELCVTSVTMNQFFLTTRLALNEFQASYYSHHRSQSALGETFRVALQWSGRNSMTPVSGCSWWCPICITR